MTNTPDKSETAEQRAREIYDQSPDVFWNSHSETRGHRHWGDLTEERREHFRDIARASSRPPADAPSGTQSVGAVERVPNMYTNLGHGQVPDMVEALELLMFAAGRLIVATDGMEQVRAERRAASEAMTEGLAALQAVPAASEAGWQPIESALKASGEE